MAHARARKIKLLLFDVDGVLTDGKLYIFPAPASDHKSEIREHKERHADSGGYGIAGTTMVEAKGFNAHDGAGISLAKLGGLQTGLITKRISETVALRARDLKLEHVYQGIIDKNSALEEILAKTGFDASEVAYVGDDIIDLPVMRRCGLAIAVPNAREAVKDEAHFITDHAGGDGALRDAIEYILRAQGKLEKVTDEYMHSKRAHKKEARK
jgi:3-deoxy-D-manno-octulosonate 8-phosphate phosphatase (KDO 8-P phosphatase)